MTRSQLITKVSHDTGLPEAQVELVMNGLFDSIAESLKQGEKVTIAGFGRFEMRARKTKSFTNPKTKVSSSSSPQRFPALKPAAF